MNEKNWKHIKTVNEWLDRDDLPEGYTIANAKFKRDFNRLSHELRMQSAYLYFIGVVMEVRYVTKMMHSCKRQSKFCDTVAGTLTRKRIENEHIKVFQKNVEQLEKRLATIDRITREDIHLTKYEPFFKSEIYNTDISEIGFAELKAMADKWNESHKDEVEKHMAEIQPELERYEQFKDRKHKAIKAEKEARKAKKKAETAYVKEIKENEKRHKAKQKRIDKSFEIYYEEVL